MERHGTEVMAPDAEGREQAHDIIFNELCAGSVLYAACQKLIGLIEIARVEGTYAVIFYCTEICMSLETDKLPLPRLDSTELHAQAAVQFSAAQEKARIVAILAR